MKLVNKIGVIVDSFNVGVREGLAKAKDVGADGVQIYAVKGEMAPENLNALQRKELKAYIQSLGLEISALCGELGWYGFQDKAANRERVDFSKRILDLAKDMGANIVTTHIGVIPEDQKSPIYESLQEACEELGQYAKSMGAFFAIETGPETAEHLKNFLDSLSTNGVSVNYDPANILMATGDDPVRGLELLKDYIVHTHVKDGIQFMKVDPREIYGTLGYEPSDNGKIKQMIAAGEVCKEMPLGQGTLDFDAYFAKLQQIGYSGYLTIERETGLNPEADIRNAVQFIKKYKG